MVLFHLQRINFLSRQKGTLQLPVTEWYGRIGDEELVEAIE